MPGTRPKRARELTITETVSIIDAIQKAMFFDYNECEWIPWHDVDVEDDFEIQQAIIEILKSYGLAPEEEKP